MSALTTLARIAVIALFYISLSLAQAQSPPQPSQLVTTANPNPTHPEAPAAAVTNPTRPDAPATRSSPSSVLAVVVQPRPSGYFVGDLATQRVLLEGDSAPITLPPPGRVNTWFERRRNTIDTDTSGRHWLVVEYQFLNAPKAVTAVTLPAWQLIVKASAAAPPLTLNIPAASLNIAPLSPPGSPQQVGVRDLRPYRVPPNIVITPILHAIAISSGGLALTIAAWLAWMLWRNKRAAATQPFARALRELRAVANDEPRAWQILHRAFDRAAGRVIQTATLPTLFERAPQLAPARPQIEDFFTQSNQLFFAHARATGDVHTTAHANSNATSGHHFRGSSPTPSGDAPANEASPRATPLTLCLHLRHIEKRHER